MFIEQILKYLNSCTQKCPSMQHNAETMYYWTALYPVVVGHVLGQSLEGGWEMVLAEARTLESGHGIASLDEWTSNTADLHQDYPIKFNTPAQVKRPFRPFQPAGVPAGQMVCDATRIVRYFGHQWVGWLVGWV